MNYLRKNIFKVTYYLIAISLFLLPVFYVVFYNYISHETYKKNYYLVKDGDVGYIKYVKMLDQPILNLESLKFFVREKNIALFNYEVAFANKKLESEKNSFTSPSYNNFKQLFDYRVGAEKKAGVVIKESVIIDGPYYIGTLKFLDRRLWKFYSEIREIRHGVSGDVRNTNKKVFMVVVDDDFNKNGKGLSIESIDIR